MTTSGIEKFRDQLAITSNEGKWMSCARLEEELCNLTLLFRQAQKHFHSDLSETLNKEREFYLKEMCSTKRSWTPLIVATGSSAMGFASLSCVAPDANGIMQATARGQALQMGSKFSGELDGKFLGNKREADFYEFQSFHQESGRRAQKEEQQTSDEHRESQELLRQMKQNAEATHSSVVGLLR